MDDNDIFVFKKLYQDANLAQAEIFCKAAIEKLQDLYPGNKIIRYDHFTIGIETDSPQSETGMDIYEIGLIDQEIPAMRRIRDEETITFRV